MTRNPHFSVSHNYFTFLVFVLNFIVSTLFEYRERQKILQNPLELSRLLAEGPTVIPDINELDSNSDEMKNDMGSDKGSPRSILQCDDSSVPRDGLQNKKASGKPDN